MAGLTGSIIKNSYKSLLRVADDTNGVDSSLTKVTDGEGTDSPLKIATETIAFQPPNTDSVTFLQVLDQDGGTPILNIDSTNERVGIGTDAPDTNTHIKTTAVTTTYTTDALITNMVGSGLMLHIENYVNDVDDILAGIEFTAYDAKSAIDCTYDASND